MKLLSTVVFVIVSVFVLPASAQEASNTKLGAQEFVGTVEVSKAPKAVWAMLTKAGFSAKAIGFVHQTGSKSFAQVGDAARVKLTDWNESGTFVVTHVKPGKELRMSFDPENGSYLCRDRWELSPAGKGTKITLTQTYTESGEQSETEIQEQVSKWEAKMATIKALVEGGS